MNLEKEIIKIIAERFGIPQKEINKDSSLTKDLNASHLEISDLILALEEKFQVEIPEEELENIEKAGDVINCITEHLDEPSAL